MSVTDSARPGASSGPLASRFAVLQSGHLEAGAGVLAFSGSSLRRCAPRYPRHALCREAAHPPGKRASPRLGEEASALDGARFSLPNPPLLANGLPSHRAANSLLAWPGLLGALCHSKGSKMGMKDSSLSLKRKHTLLVLSSCAPGVFWGAS